MMREQTLPRFKPQTGLLPGMLKRTKYTRLRNDSLTSLEDRPPRMPSLKGELCLASHFAPLDPRMPLHHGSSTLRDFIPRVANIRLQSPISLLGLRGQTSPDGERSTDGHTDGPLLRADWGSGPSERFLSQPALFSPPPTDQNRPQSAFMCSTRRPITLHRMASLPWTPGCPPPHPETGLCCLKSSSAVDDGALWKANPVVHHHIKYMGSVEVTQSMRTLDFATRMRVTRDAISRLCERTPAKTTVKNKRPVSKAVSAVLGPVNLQFSGSSIIFSVSTDSVTLIAASSLQKIAHHPMQSISFASGGDPDMEDFIAYVAKDFANHRACHILECPRGRAGGVIDSIGQAFERRFRQLLSQTPPFLSASCSQVNVGWSPEEAVTDGTVSESRNYYNVGPGKTPSSGGKEELPNTKNTKPDPEFQEVCSPLSASLYENCSITDGTLAPPADRAEPDVSADQGRPLLELQMQEEGWFHGRLGRKQAESLLTCSGDFLVRESSSTSGQYVLSGLEGATVRHLLLVDPHGQVRTRDQVFLSVGHLVRFHMENQMPIISGTSELLLKQPILQSH